MKLHGHDIEVGDKVWHRDFGCCRIERIEDEYLPYYVKFENDMPNICCSDKHLFWQPFDIPAHAYQKPKRLVEKGIVVYRTDIGTFDCTFNRLTKKRFAELNRHLTFIRFVEETVEMVEE